MDSKYLQGIRRRWIQGFLQLKLRVARAVAQQQHQLQHQSGLQQRQWWSVVAAQLQQLPLLTVRLQTRG